jgi:hypothetical protein
MNVGVVDWRAVPSFYVTDRSGTSRDKQQERWSVEDDSAYITVACTRTFHPSQLENYIKRRMEVKINQKVHAI